MMHAADFALAAAIRPGIKMLPDRNFADDSVQRAAPDGNGSVDRFDKNVAEHRLGITIMVLEADVAASRETFYFAPRLRFPINDLFIVDLDSDVVVDEGDSHAIPLAETL